MLLSCSYGVCTKWQLSAGHHLQGCYGDELMQLVHKGDLSSALEVSEPK